MVLMQNLELQPRQDRLGWIYDALEIYIVSSAYFLLDSSFLLAGGMETRWNNYVPIKLNILIWRLTLQSAPTRGRLSYRGIEVDSIMCLICYIVVETVDHLFVGFNEVLAFRLVLLFGGMCIFQIRFLLSPYFLGRTLFR